MVARNVHRVPFAGTVDARLLADAERIENDFFGNQSSHVNFSSERKEVFGVGPLQQLPPAGSEEDFLCRDPERQAAAQARHDNLTRSQKVINLTFFCLLARVYLSILSLLLGSC